MPVWSGKGPQRFQLCGGPYTGPCDTPGIIRRQWNSQHTLGYSPTSPGTGTNLIPRDHLLSIPNAVASSQPQRQPVCPCPPVGACQPPPHCPVCHTLDSTRAAWHLLSYTKTTPLVSQEFYQDRTLHRAGPHRVWVLHSE